MRKLAYIPLFVLSIPFIMAFALFKVLMYFAAILDIDFDEEEESMKGWTRTLKRKNETS